MQVRRNANLVECIMNSEDLEKYDLEISEMRNKDAQDMIGEKLHEILEDINEELDEDEKLVFDTPMNVEMLIGNTDSILIRIHIPVTETNEKFIETKKSSKFNRDEVKDLAFSFKTLDECIKFAKQIKILETSLIERSKNLSEEDLITAKEEELEIPDYVPETLVEHFKNLRKKVVDVINESIKEGYKKAKEFDGLNTSLYKMKGIYYFICRDIAFNAMQGIPEEFYLGSIEDKPNAYYIEEHGEIIIKENATNSLAML